VRRHAAHRRLAELTSDPEERARHLALSAEGTDEAIATTLDTAASLARNRGAPDAAAELLEHAIRLTSATSVDDARRRHLEAADHRFVAGDQAGAEGHARRALELSRPGGERAEAMRRIAHLECERGAVLDARRSLEAAAAEPGASTAVSAAVLRDLADLAVDGGDLSGAEKHARTAEDLARRAGDPSTALAAHTTRARVALLRGDPSGSLTETRPDTSGATPAADPQNLLLAEAEMLTGRHDRARGRLETLAAAAHDRGDEPAHRIALVRLAELELRVGSWDRARSWAREALDLAGLFGVEGTHETALLAYLAAVEGLEDDCRTAARTVLRSEREDQVARLWSLGALGVLELSLGRADLAIRQLGPVGTFVDAMGLGEPEWLPFLPDEAEALVTVGEHEAADRRIAWLEARGRALGRDSVLAAAGRCRGSLLAATGNLAEALISAESAVELCGSLPLPFERGRCLLTLGVLRRRDRQKRDARDALGRALELFETLGARIWAERAREELARISGRRASLTELTESETRVVRLAAAGRTNQEIGQTLSMSVRTVEGHLSHAYAKLGLRSRTELAVFFTD
jgi:DNA-binding CsgD family transcriptional regulator